MSASSGKDPSVCPLCSGPNACARVVNPQAEVCWCLTETFPPALLDQVPSADKRQRCICSNCVQKAQQLAFALDE